jgi:hypothetical protein
MTDENTTPEAPETPAVAAPDPVAAPRAAEALKALISQEKASRDAHQAAQEQQSAIAQSRAMQELAKSDPVSFLERSGIKREDISQRLDEGADPVSGIREDISTLRTELQQQREAAEQARMDAALSEARSHVHSYIQSAEDAPLVRVTGSADQVWQVMTNHHQATGQVISESEAARQVEAHLSSQIDKLLEGEATRAILEEKLKSKGQTQPQVPEPKHRSTLTNQMQTAENQRVRQDPNFNREQSLAEAAKLLKWE